MLTLGFTPHASNKQQSFKGKELKRNDDYCAAILKEALELIQKNPDNKQTVSDTFDKAIKEESPGDRKNALVGIKIWLEENHFLPK